MYISVVKSYVRVHNSRAYFIDFFYNEIVSFKSFKELKNIHFSFV
jgi:hypothetical protein